MGALSFLRNGAVFISSFMCLFFNRSE